MKQQRYVQKKAGNKLLENTMKDAYLGTKKDHRLDRPNEINKFRLKSE